MVTTFVVRLIAERLTEGRIVGEVEHVETGRREVVLTAPELLRALAPEPREPER